MSKDLYQSDIIAYRILDPEIGKFCCSGRGLHANNGRSVWFSKSAAAVALNNMPSNIRDRLVIKEFDLVERHEEFTWSEKRPMDGDSIEAYSVPMGKWFPGTYYNDGIDGIIDWKDGGTPCEIEEYGEDTITKWRPSV